MLVRPASETRAQHGAMLERAVQASPGLAQSFAQGGAGPSTALERRTGHRAGDGGGGGGGTGAGGERRTGHPASAEERERALASQRIQAHARRRRAALELNERRAHTGGGARRSDGLLGDGLLGDAALSQAALIRGQRSPRTLSPRQGSSSEGLAVSISQPRTPLVSRQSSSVQDGAINLATAAGLDASASGSGSGSGSRRASAAGLDASARAARSPAKAAVASSRANSKPATPSGARGGGGGGRGGGGRGGGGRFGADANADENLQAARIQAHARRRHATRILRERAEASYATAAVSRAAEVYGFDDVGAVEGAESGRGGGGGGGGGGFFGGVLEAAAASHHDGARSAPPDSPQRRQSSPSKLKSPGAKSHGAKSPADGRARPFLVVDTSSELQARQVRQVVDTSELQDLAGAIGRYYAGRRRRQRALRAAHAVLGAAMISASVEQRTAREIRRAAALRSLRADRFDHLVHEQLMPWVLRKRLAVAAEDFDAAKAYKLLESGVLERRAELDDLERRKAHAVATESYQLAAELKEQSDTLRVQIALLLHRASSSV